MWIWYYMNRVYDIYICTYTVYTTCIYMCIYIYIRICTYIYTYIYIYEYVQIHIYICIHTCFVNMVCVYIYGLVMDGSVDRDIHGWLDRCSQHNLCRRSLATTSMW